MNRVYDFGQPGTFIVGKIAKKTGGQNRQKNSLKECVFINLALKIQCYVVKIKYQMNFTN